MRNTIKFLLLSIYISLSSKVLSQTKWELDKQKDDIRVYTTSRKDSEFKAFKAVVLLNASADEVIKKLKDADRYLEWYGYTKTSRLLKEDDNELYTYVETIFPWPFRNRDMVYRMSINRLDSGSIKISLIGIPNYIPEKKGIVRMKKAEGHILLNSFNGKTEVIYTLYSEPGESISPWLANRSIAELPFKTLSGLREILKKENKNSTQ